jgi:PAS domain S-box-containing protein
VSRVDVADGAGVHHKVRELIHQIGRGVPRAYLVRLAAQAPLNGCVTVAVVLLIAGFLLSEGYSVAVLAWAGIQLSLAALVLARWMRSEKRHLPLDSTRSRRGLYHALMWAALSGTLWGSLTAFLPDAPPHIQIVLILTMGGMAAGASATLAAVPQVAAVFILGCTVPATLYYLAIGGGEGRTLALVFAVFTIAMVAMSQVVFTALRRQFNAEWHAQQLEEMGAALRESEQRFRATFQNAAVGIAHVGMDGSWLRVNDRVCEIVGYSRDELIARTFQDVTHPDDVSVDLGLFDSMVRGESNGYQIEKRYQHKDGHVVWVHLTTALQRDDDGEPMYRISVIQDITARKEVEQALRESDQAKDEFLAVLGHELRNPLAPLRTGLELLEQAPRSPELDTLLPMMDRQLSHLVRLVDDLLDISRISRGAIELQRAPLSVNAPIQTAVEQTRYLVELRRHRLLVQQSDQPLHVDGDFERLTQVFANLLGNAAKYMKPGGTISVTWGAENGQAVVRVRDSGYGIPADRIKSLFELFSQIPEHRDGTDGGLGVGLALSRRIIEMHGGSIEAMSDGLGRGSEFIVRLPMSRADVEGALVDRSVVSDGPPRRVLVVDDNIDAAEGLRMLLEMNGHTAEAVYDGPTALRQIEEFHPDVVLLDLGLPGMDGEEVARRARSLPCGKETLIVAVTGWGQDEDRHRTREAGFDMHLTKPIDWRQLAPILLSSRPFISAPLPIEAYGETS